MRRIGRELSPPWPLNARVCFVCRTGVVENVHHFLMECPKYSEKRDALLERAAVIYDRASNIRGPNSFKDMPSKEQARILLGKRFDNPRAEEL